MSQLSTRDGTPDAVDCLRLPTPAQLATLGTVLCLHRPGRASELDGWSRALRAEAHSGLDDDGVQESVWFFDADAVCCWRLYLLPDTDFLGWAELSTRLPGICDGVEGSVGERLWQALSRRLRGEAWQATALRFHALPATPVVDAPQAMLVASLAAVSPMGAEVARRVASGHGGEARVAIDDCCCRRAATASLSYRDSGRDAYVPFHLDRAPGRRPL